jgi:hypothetical protein
MKQIRSNVFETNSSSTHSIAISKKPVVIGKYIYFDIGEYGWENDVADTANYLYTAILAQDNRDDLLDKLKKILDKYSIKYEFKEPLWRQSSIGDDVWLEYGYIDHSYELIAFLNAILSNEDLLMRYLFGNSCVYTGNDNQDPDPSGCDIAKEEYYDWDSNKMIKNPYHDSKNYDYYYKTN